LFLAVHERIDDPVDPWRQLADTAAKRPVPSTTAPLATPQAVAKCAGQITPIEHGPVEDQAVLRHLARRLGEVSERARRVSAASANLTQPYIA
jgi:DNA-binding ferritin-like protein